MTPHTAISESVGFCVSFWSHMFVVGEFCKSGLVSLLGAKYFPPGNWSLNWDFIMRKQVQQINSRCSSVKLSKIGLSVLWNSFWNIAYFVKRDSSKVVFPLNKWDASWEFNPKKFNNESYMLFKLKMCSAWTTLLNKGPEISFSMIPSARKLAKKTSSISSLMLCRRKSVLWKQKIHYIVFMLIVCTSN